MRQPSTPKRPSAGASSETCQNVPTHCLGQGRCLLARQDPAAEQPLRRAALFNSMGYRPVLAETAVLIAQTTALAS